MTARPVDELRQSGRFPEGAQILVLESIADIVEAYRDWEAWDASRRIRRL